MKPATRTIQPANASRDKALGLQEIKAHIVAFLRPKDILTCRLINKSWATSFIPWLFQTVSAQQTTWIPPFLSQNTHHVQQMEICIEQPAVLALQGLTRLKFLVLWLLWEKDLKNPKNISKLQGFLREECAQVEDLTLHHLQDEFACEVYSTFTKANFPRIKRFVFSTAVFSEDSFRLVWKAICQMGVQDLTLTPVLLTEMFFQNLMKQRIQEQGQENSSPNCPQDHFDPVTKVRRLDVNMVYPMEMVGSEVLAMLLLCPDLEYFHVVYLDSFPQDEFVKAVQAGTWSRLHSFSAGIEGLKDNHVAEVIKSMTHVEVLRLAGTEFGPLSFEALRVHPEGFSSLKELNLESCNSVSSEMIQTVLEESPRLKRFVATSPLLLRHVLQGRSWACTSSLRQLSVDFVLSEGIDEVVQTEEEYLLQNRAMLGRIATLTGLKEFTTSSGRRLKTRDQRCIRLDIEGGLKQLETLERLEAMRFGYYSDSIGLEGLDWILEHWPNLTALDFMLPNGSGDLLPRHEAKIEQKGLEIAWNSPY